jgi:hypothetical protein
MTATPSLLLLLLPELLLLFFTGEAGFSGTTSTTGGGVTGVGGEGGVVTGMGTGTPDVQAIHSGVCSISEQGSGEELRVKWDSHS